MKLTVLIFVSLYAAVECGLPQGYSLPTPGSSGGGIVSGGGGIIRGGGGSISGVIVSGGYFNQSTSEAPILPHISGDLSNRNIFRPSAALKDELISDGIAATSCADGQVLHVDGRCVTPQVMRNIYVYDVPEHPRPVGPRPTIPLPKVDHNILFVRLPEDGGALEPIVIPPPQQKNIVYVLKKGTAVGGQKVINVPAPPKSQPEVYFVNYGDGQNPTLPGGADLQTALNSAVHQGIGQVIGGGISGGTVSGGGVSGDIISGGGISSDFGVSGGSSVGGSIISGGSFGGGIISGGSISGGSISGGSISGGSISGGSVTGGSISGGISSTPSGLYSPP
ncbi:uncharacterized protein [Macrobrachium rosenbergii]|uniref:uncharacterized protein isoform X1 n=1 Tax=Macrobrachium rosenbergii TaxID=79674 RepID=UPI0034D6EDE2